MKYWAAEHVYEHPWHTVVNAAYRKYPNPMNRSITAIDVVQQSVDDGVLKTERVLQSQFSIPSWASKLTGFCGVQYSREYTEIDPISKQMVLTTRNLNCSGFLRVDESLIYKPHHSDPDRTQVSQKMAVTVNLPAFTDYCERAFLSAYQTNALKGRTGLEWVIDQLGNQLKREYTDLSSRVQQVSSEVHELSDKLFSGRGFNSANSS